MLSLDFTAPVVFLKNVQYKLVTETMKSKPFKIIDATKILKTCIKSPEIINNDNENMNREIQNAFIL